MSTSNRAICPLSWFPLCHALRLSVRSSGRPASSMKTTGHRRDSWRTQLFRLWPSCKIQVCWWISWFCLLGWVKPERPTIFKFGELSHPQSWFNGSLMGGSWWYTMFYHGGINIQESQLYTSTWHIIWKYTALYSDILFGILSGICSDILCGSLLHSISHLFWHTFWHIFRHSFWHSNWHIFLTFFLAYILIYIFLPPFRHSAWHSPSNILSGIISDILAFSLASLSGMSSGPGALHTGARHLARIHVHSPAEMAEGDPKTWQVRNKIPIKTPWLMLIYLISIQSLYARIMILYDLMLQLYAWSHYNYAKP